MTDMYVVELGIIKEITVDGAPRVIPFELILHPFINFSKALNYFNELKMYTFGKRYLKLYEITEDAEGNDEFINLKIEKGGNIINLDKIVNDYYFICRGFVNS